MVTLFVFTSPLAVASAKIIPPPLATGFRFGLPRSFRPTVSGNIPDCVP
jgi:hypothetical protein